MLINHETLLNRLLWSDISFMKVLLPLLLVTGLVAGALYFMNPDSNKRQSDIDMLELGNFAFQQQRYNDAFQWFNKAALQGDKEAQYQLSQMFSNGQGVEQSDILALNWMQKAASTGFGKAEFAYANMLFFGKGLDKPNPGHALLWYKKAAKQGYPKAMLKLAKLLTENDIFLALDWVIKAEAFPVTQQEAISLRKKIAAGITTKANHGDKQAQYKLAMMYLSGNGLPNNIALAKSWLQKSAQQGHLQAQYQLGLIYAQNQQGWKKSLFWLTQASKQGHQDAGYAIPAIISTHNNQGDIKEAWRWLYHGLRKHEPKIVYNFAVIRKNGELGLTQSDSQFAERLTFAANHNIIYAQNDAAIYNVLQNEKNKNNLKWLESAGKAGDNIAQFNLGLLFARGNSFSPNDEKALYWWKLAESNNNSKAQLLLGLFYHIGRGTGRSEQDAIHWYEKAAKNKTADALFNLAMIYYHGRGVNQDYKKAAQYLKQLASQNDSKAQNLYASLFLDGKGVNYSPETAVAWFTRAARLGNINAMFNLATQYRSGTGVAQDDKKAMYWYKKAAEKEFAPAENALGYLYAEGRGTKKNLDQAEEWFYRANEHGLRLAGKNLDVLKHQGSYSLVTLQINTDIRSSVLTDKQIDLSHWLEVHHTPIL